MKSLILISLITGSLFAGVPDSYNSCKGCHGIDGTKVALGKSKVIKSMTKEELIISLKGYADGSYGGPMKGLMKGQVARLTDSDIEDIATYLSELK